MGRPGRPSKFGTTGLYRDADKNFRLDFKYRDQKTGEVKRHRENLGAISPTAARASLKNAMDLAARGLLERSRGIKGRTVRDAFNGYLAEWVPTNKPHDIKERTSKSEICVRVLGPDTPLEKIGPRDIEKLKAEKHAAVLDRRDAILAKNGVSVAKRLKERRSEERILAANRTVNQLLIHVRHAFGVFAAWGWITQDQLASIRRAEKLPEKEGRIRWLTPDEEERLMATLNDRLRPIARTALLTGMRQGEILALKKAAVDLDRGVIAVTRAKNRRARSVFVNKELAEILRASIDRSPGDWVFTNQFETRYTAGGFRRLWRDAVKSAGIKNLTFHDLRHSTATRLRESGADLDVVKEVLGHSSIAVTLKYAHLGRDHVRAAMESLSKPAPRV